MKEEQLREDQRREALARKELEARAEETVPPPAAQRFEEAPRIEEPRAERPLQAEPPPPQPKIDPKVLLESAGLVMIETDRSKAPPPVQAEEPQHLGRPRRERSKAVPQEEELQQVETRK
jgi:hypothetical protein